jgi:hypothetical protein
MSYPGSKELRTWKVVLKYNLSVSRKGTSASQHSFVFVGTEVWTFGRNFLSTSYEQATWETSHQRGKSFQSSPVGGNLEV